MKTAQELASQLNPDALRQAHDICAFMNESEIGIGVFNEDLILLAANPAYRETRDLPPGSTAPGTSLVEIAMIMHRNVNLSYEAVHDRIEQDIVKLKSVGTDKIFGKNGRSEDIILSRFIKPSGLIVETVEQVDSGEQPFLSIAEEPSRSFTMGYARLMSALDNMADGFAVYNPQGILVAVNERCRQLQPYIANELYVGARHEDVIRAVYNSGHVELDGVSEEEFLAFAHKELVSPSSGTLDQMSDGRSLRFAGCKMEDGSTVFMQSDVTELVKQQEENRKIAEARAIESERAEIAFENLFAGLAVFDEEENLVLCNSNYRKMLGLSEEFMKPGRSRADIIKTAIEQGAFAKNHTDSALKAYKDSVGSSEEKRLKYIMSDGKIYHSRYRPVTGGGAIVLVLDVTKEERALQLVERANQKLERSNEELQNFAYVASHDLQEPLRKIEAFGDRLLKKYNDLLPEDGQMYMDRIQNASGRMRQLINDLLSFSRVTSNAKSFEPLNLNEILDGVKFDIQMRLEEVGGVINSSKLPVIDADPVQMRQLFQNLLSNSLKFKREGVSPIVTISARVIERSLRQGDMLELRFADNGIGFDNRYKDQIFAIFQRLHGRMEFEGTGIGLSTCRKIIERHNGTIDADGKEGEGATFIVRLPMKQAEETDE